VFIKIKPTIVNLFFATTLFGGLFFGKSLLKHIFADAFHLTDGGWTQLTRRWGLFFLLLAALNEIVWRNFSTDSWVAFKTFGIMPLTMVFAVFQIGLIKRHELTNADRTREDQ
jgi:intracellular septation protein